MYSPNKLSATKIALERRLVCVPAQPKQQRAPKINQRKRSRSQDTVPNTHPHTRIENAIAARAQHEHKNKKRDKTKVEEQTREEGGRGKGCCWTPLNLLGRAMPSPDFLILEHANHARHSAPPANGKMCKCNAPNPRKKHAGACSRECRWQTCASRGEAA
jgi:hypothetical protein